MGISIRAYARHRGVSDAAVRKAIAAGRITPEADGTIDAERVDREWARNSDAPRNGTATRAVKVAVPEPSGAAGDGTAALPAGGTSLLQARTVNEVVKAQTNKVRLARLKGELVDRNAGLLSAFWPGFDLKRPAVLDADAGTIAGDLGLDAGDELTLHVAPADGGEPRAVRSWTVDAARRVGQGRVMRG
jgi:nitrogen fixation protein